MAGHFETTMKKFLEDYEKQEEDIFFKEFMVWQSSERRSRFVF